jgi:hypothetical protein
MTTNEAIIPAQHPTINPMTTTTAVILFFDILFAP